MTTPRKVRRHSIDSACCSMTKLTWQNRFTRSLSGGYKMTNSSRVRKLFFKNGRSNQRKRSSWQRAVSRRKLTVNERIEPNGDGEWFNHMPCFCSLFSALDYLRSASSHYLRVLALTRPQSSALLIEGLHIFYQEDSMRLISCVRLITMCAS